MATVSRAIAGCDDTPLEAVGISRAEDTWLVRERRSPARHLQATGSRWRLTPREQQVLQLVVHGESNRTIAESLGFSIRTAEAHVAALLRKSGADCRAQLTAWFWSQPAVWSAPTPTR